MANSEQGDRLTINLRGLREEIERFATGDSRWEELEMAGKIRSLIRNGLRKTPFTVEFVRQAVKYSLGMRLVQRVEGFRKDKAWTDLPIEEKLSRLIEFATEMKPQGAQILLMHEDLLPQVDFSARRLEDLKKGVGDRMTETEAEAIARVIPISKEELLGRDPSQG